MLTSGADYPRADTGHGVLGAREHFVADLDVDGKDKIVLLPYDDCKADRTAGLIGTAVSQPYTTIRAAVGRTSPLAGGSGPKKMNCPGAAPHVGWAA